MIKPYYQTDLGRLYHGDCLDIMPHLDPVDLVLTSPPYDNLRDYQGYHFDFEKTAEQIKNILNNGAVCIWVVNDQTIDGDESGTSFKQALYFKKIGLNLYDTMIWHKDCVVTPTEGRYYNVFEYMFIISNGRPKTINFINDRLNITKGSNRRSNKNIGKEKRKYGGNFFKTRLTGRRFNVWKINPYSKPIGHPAIFPEALARDHIISWSNENDMVLDPMAGSGTTLKMAEHLKRLWIGIEISEKYCELIARRLELETKQLNLFDPLDTVGYTKKIYPKQTPIFDNKINDLDDALIPDTVEVGSSNLPVPTK